MNTPTPALVSRQAAQRLPRLPLVLLCLAYLVPGLLGRAPWKNADLIAFGYMANMARGVTDWWTPALGGVPGDGSLLPYWIGAASIKLLGGVLGDALAARLPFLFLLALTLWLSWAACYYLARTEAAQPAAFAFGGEAHPVDYARAIADGSLLALMASLGLLQLGHETTPDLLQLTAVAAFMFGIAVAPFHGLLARVVVLVALPTLATSGSPAIAVALGLLGLLITHRSAYAPVRTLQPWLLVAVLGAGLCASVLHLWAWRLGESHSLRQMLRLVVWFTWPSWPLALWTLLRWRSHLTRRHMAVPLATLLVTLVASGFMGGSDRALLLALPALSVLAAFALPTLRRSVAAAIDWFSLFYFTFWALLFWVVYASLQFGVPAKPAANVMRLLPGYAHGPLVWPALLLALAGTFGWFALVVWRAGRHRHPLWTSLVLPASGVALGWLLVMSLHLPVLDYARSYSAFLERVAKVVPAGACMEVEAPPALRAALQAQGGYLVAPVDTNARCQWRLVSAPVGVQAPKVKGWTLVARPRRPGDKEEAAAIYRRDSRD